MSKIGLINVDGHNFPNLALMKLSTYHKSLGDSVKFVTLGNYDKIYMSKTFTYTPDYKLGFINCDSIEKGGTGYKEYSKTLPEHIDKLPCDYSIYPQFKSAYGFLTRGCPNKCAWCVVPHKEGDVHPYADIEEILQGRKEAILMDNNALSHEHGLTQIEKIIKLGIKIDFNQGLDSRIIAKDIEISKLLSKVKWMSTLRMACDTKSQIPFIDKALSNLNQFGFKNNRVFVYVLVKEIPDALERLDFLKGKGCIPFAQPYRDFETNKPVSATMKKFIRWVDRTQIFYSTTWEKYNA